MDANLGVSLGLAQCFGDVRNPVFTDHSVRELLAQRIYGLALGYEDINDHQRLRLDPLLAVACNKLDPLGQERFNPAHRGVALAGATTPNRLALSNKRNSRSPKLPHDPAQIQALLLKMRVLFLANHPAAVVRDIRASATLVHCPPARP